MVRLRKNEIDLLRSPAEIAQRRYYEQIDEVAKGLKPDGMHPATQWLHQRGLTLKGIDRARTR